MKDSYDCDCGICGICNGISKPLPPQEPGTHKWQHEDTGELIDLPDNEIPDEKWHRLADV